MKQSSHRNLPWQSWACFILGVCSLFLSLIASLPSIYLGHKALKIIRSNDQHHGYRLTLTGLAIAYAVSVISLVVIGVLLFYPDFY